MSEIIPKQRCPFCGYEVDRTTAAREFGIPKPGDVSVCFRCMEVAFFDAEMRLRRPLPIEMENLRNSPEWLLVEEIREAKRRLLAEMN